MASALFKTIRMLEEARLHFFVERTRPDFDPLVGDNGWRAR